MTEIAYYKNLSGYEIWMLGMDTLKTPDFKK